MRRLIFIQRSFSLSLIALTSAFFPLATCCREVYEILFGTKSILLSWYVSCVSHMYTVSCAFVLSRAQQGKIIQFYSSKRPEIDNHKKIWINCRFIEIIDRIHTFFLQAGRRSLENRHSSDHLRRLFDVIFFTSIPLNSFPCLGFEYYWFFFS